MSRLLIILFVLTLVRSAAGESYQPVHALAQFGQPAEPLGFSHFAYVNPNAPKGGTVRLAVQGTFDSLNPFIVKGNAANGSALIYESLTYGSLDERFTRYGLLAESMTLDPGHRWVEYKLREEARWHDGKPVTPDDVVWTFETLVAKGRPLYANYFDSVASAEKTGPRTVRFVFSGPPNPELALMVGQFLVLPKHYWETGGRDFEKTTLKPPLGSGPYRIAEVDPGRSVSYVRVADYWGDGLAVNRGRHNFDEVRFKYYRDSNVMVEALIAGEHDIRIENISKQWATAYDVDAVAKGLLRKHTVTHEITQTMQGYAFNMRRPIFQDRVIRQAIAYAFDFEWSNRTLFHGMYRRLESYFANSPFASDGPPSPAELALLEPHRDHLPAEVFQEPFRAPSTRERTLRENLANAADMLLQSGYQLRNGELYSPGGEPIRFEILLDSSVWERITGPFLANLRRLGIEATMRTVDSAQYVNRITEFDFDMVVVKFPASHSPGSELRNYLSSGAAVEAGSGNLMAIQDDVVDELVETLARVPDTESQVTAARALDRVLLHGHYVVPHWYSNEFHVVHWDIFGRPERSPRYGLSFLDTWWFDEKRATRIPDRSRSTQMNEVPFRVVMGKSH